MELYRTGSFPPANNIEFIDTEFTGMCQETSCAATSWAFSAQPLTGLGKTSVASALRPGAARVTVNGEMLRRSPTHQAPQPMPHPVFVSCNDLPASSAPLCLSGQTQQVPAAGLPFLQSRCSAMASPFGELCLQLPTNGLEAAKLMTSTSLDENILLVPSSNQSKRSNIIGVEGDESFHDFFFGEMPASPARGAPDTGIKPSAAGHSKAEVADADAQSQQPQSHALLPLPRICSSAPSSSRDPAGLQGPSIAEPACPALEGDSGNPRVPAEVPSTSGLAGGASAAGSARCGRPALPTSSSQSSLDYNGGGEGEAESDCESEVVKRCASRADLDITSSAACAAGGAAATPVTPVVVQGGDERPAAAVEVAEMAVAPAAGSGAVKAQTQAQAQVQVQAPRGRKRRAAAVAAVRAVRAAREQEDDDDEDYDEHEGLGGGAGARGPKRVKKVSAPRANNTGKARGGDVTCLNCRATTTPQWRSGPDGSRTLCNACGVRFKKGKPLAYREKKERQMGGQ